MTEPSIKRILVPLDFGDLTEPVLEHAAYFARVLGAELTLLYVIHVPHLAEAGAWLDPVVSPTVEQDITRQLQETARGKLTEMAKGLQDGGAKVEVRIREGVPYSEIIGCAREIGAQLILMGSQGRTGISHLLMGSVAERVMRRSHINVLVVKPPEPKPES